MWIDNYDDPDETTYEEALEILRQNGFKDVTEEANKQNKRIVFKVFARENEVGVYYCADEDEVVALVVDLSLVYVSGPPDRLQEMEV